MKALHIIGRKDFADFPEFELEEIPIKIDTGAYTSSIHCHKIELKERDGKAVLNFCLLDPTHPQYEEKVFSTQNFKEKKVKSSNGISEKRYVISTQIFLFGKVSKIELSLSERGKMRFPVLIGRKYLKGKFLVNPSVKDLSYHQKLNTK